MVTDRATKKRILSMLAVKDKETFTKLINWEGEVYKHHLVKTDEDSLITNKLIRQYFNIINGCEFTSKADNTHSDHTITFERLSIISLIQMRMILGSVSLNSLCIKSQIPLTSFIKSFLGDYEDVVYPWFDCVFVDISEQQIDLPTFIYSSLYNYSWDIPFSTFIENKIHTYKIMKDYLNNEPDPEDVQSVDESIKSELRMLPKTTTKLSLLGRIKQKFLRRK